MLNPRTPEPAAPPPAERPRKDLFFGSATLALACGYYVMAASIPPSALADAIGPAGLPKAYAWLLAVLSLVLIGRSLAARPATARIPTGDTRTARRAAGVLAIGIVYIAVVSWLGYVLSLAGLILATSRCQGGRLTRRAAVVAAAGALVFWLLFVVLLRIAQPAGLWPDLL